MRRWHSEGQFQFRDVERDADAFTSTPNLFAGKAPSGKTLPLQKFLNKLVREGDDSSTWLALGDQWLALPYLSTVVGDYATIEFLTATYDVHSGELEIPYVCKENNRRFTVISLVLYLPTTSHDNILIIDWNAHTIERFEPNGSTPVAFAMYYGDGTGTKLDVALVNWIKKWTQFTYIPPLDFCPMGPQHKSIPTDGEEGFCQTWTMVYAQCRVQFGNLTAEEIIDVLMSYSPRQLTALVNAFAHRMAAAVNTSTYRLSMRIVSESVFASQLFKEIEARAKPEEVEIARQILEDITALGNEVYSNPSEFNRRNFDGACGTLRQFSIEIDENRKFF